MYLGYTKGEGMLLVKACKSYIKNLFIALSCNSGSDNHEANGQENIVYHNPLGNMIQTFF